MLLFLVNQILYSSFFQCQQPGHMARDCPTGGGGGDCACHKVIKGYYYLVSNIKFKFLSVSLVNSTQKVSLVNFSPSRAGHQWA